MKEREKAVALITVLAFMVIMMFLAIWLTAQMRTHLKFTASLKRYEKLFALADGACSRALYYLKTHIPRPRLFSGQAVSITQNLPAYLDQNINGTSSKGEIVFFGYSPKPLPGWMLNWVGYSNYHLEHYKAIGNATEEDHCDTVSALVCIITRSN